MIKRIAFFTVGFAHNRLTRMRFYEQIFPKSVKMYLITTDRYRGKEKESYQDEYTLSRTEVITLKYNPLALPFEIRKFCRKNKIDRIFNLGFHTGALALLPATIMARTQLALNILVDIFNQHRMVETKKEAVRDLLTLFLLYPLVYLSTRVMFTDKINYHQAPFFFFSSKKKMRYLAGPVNTSLFKIKNKRQARKKLGIPLQQKVVIFVGRINYLKCADILKKLIEHNADIHFILIGRLMDQSILQMGAKNLTIIEKKKLEELVDYYNASDFSFCLNRGGAGIGIVSSEALACGVPIMVAEKFKLPDGAAVFQIPIDYTEADKVIKDFFALPRTKKVKLSKEARKYAEKYYSDNAWKERYLEAYLR